MKEKVIVHNHWDREWFTTSEVTSRWLGEVFSRVKDLSEKNPDFVYVMDGQTAVIEDLLTENPQVEKDLKKLVKEGKLLVGPYYTQIDWRIPKEPSILKNLEVGKYDAEKLGKCMKVGWLLDNFGHISQGPQVHKLFGIEKVFLWRGVSFENDEISQEFLWKGSDGTTVQAVFLVGGYRNLYNLKETKEMAEKRLKHEKKKLKRFSRSDEVLLLDGYDIDLSPEDPQEYLNIQIVSPEDFPERFPGDVPVLSEELLSGRYACTFPGTLSTRVYLKLESDLIEDLLKLEDILSALNGEKPQEILWREYLKTLAHDNICGVCVDPVHEKMERTYRRMYFLLKRSVEEKLKELVEKARLKRGLYVFSLSSFPYDHWYCDGERTVRLRTDGAGFFRVETASQKKETNKDLSWKNNYYEAHFEKDGSLLLNGKRSGVLNLFEEKGDTYSTFVEETDFSVTLKKLDIVSRTEHSMVVEMERIVQSHLCRVETKERIVFDETPLVKWNLVLNTKGKNYKLSMSYETGTGEIFAKMPFDVVKREEKDDYLLPESLPESLKGTFLAARETGVVREFPFQGFVSIYDGKMSKTFLAKGLREYWMENKRVHVTLVRSIEWIAKDVEGRVGDAGPMMYVPGAKCEGNFSMRLSFMELESHPRSEEFFRWYTLFDCPPLFLEIESDGEENERVLFKSKLPWVGVNGTSLWVFNPYLEEVEDLKPLQIGTRRIEPLSGAMRPSELSILNFPEFPVLHLESSPEDEAVDLLKKTVSELDAETSRLSGRDDVKSKHRYFSLLRTKKEMELSLFHLQGEEKLARELNELRMKRRTYDYLVELFESEEKA
ncbi:alpha-mannosidase [Thermotoga sp. SG1]|uniref:glycoside hydrolase family 38 N-terminal domain-containing protein n=1 Tax=Thermotoga sp. SG1 TaxID=126739 RepID=UPI000C761456|nr:alpha-mannosidase [Thermotoga sp. SG1]PLV56253.1 alpha-mannosidase [Thermotoga sp. SG1]